MTDLSPHELGLLVGPVTEFGVELRRRGVEVGPGRVEAAVRALSVADVRDADRSSYWALRCSMVSRREDLEAFDEAYAAIWEESPDAEVPFAESAQLAGAPESAETDRDLPLPPRSKPDGPGDSRTSMGEQASIHSGPGGESEEGDGESASLGTRSSAHERLRQMDFRDWSGDDFRVARPWVERIARSLPRRPTRRVHASNSGSLIDRRGTLRRAMRTEGHPIDLMLLERRTAPRRILLLVDISGSMEGYARPLIMFCQAARQASHRVEAFAFGTRLTRLTREMAERDPEAAIRRAAEAVPDWAGGTRIGENLRTLNASWGRRGVVHGAVVIICSDGWERGQVDTLGREMERLHRAARLIVWANPLAAQPDYEPLAAGMAAALPYIDHFLPGHNLASLEHLVEVVELAEQPRPRQHPTRASAGGGRTVSAQGRSG